MDGRESRAAREHYKNNAVNAASRRQSSRARRSVFPRSYIQCDRNVSSWARGGVTNDASRARARVKTTTARLHKVTRAENDRAGRVAPVGAGRRAPRGGEKRGRTVRHARHGPFFSFPSPAAGPFSA